MVEEVTATQYKREREREKYIWVRRFISLMCFRVVVIRGGFEFLDLVMTTQFRFRLVVALH